MLHGRGVLFAYYFLLVEARSSRVLLVHRGGFLSGLFLFLGTAGLLDLRSYALRADHDSAVLPKPQTAVPT